jgi:hypothetical protein
MFVGPALNVTNTDSHSYSRGSESPAADFDRGDNWILNVKHSSPLFINFCSGLGTLTSLKNLRIFSGGMDTSDYASDGKFALCWIEMPSEVEQSVFIGKSMVLFHSVPLMPPGINTRKRHVGNDFVHIVFCEESQLNTYGNDVGMQIISGEFCFVTILVVPMCENTLASITLILKEDLDARVKRNLSHITGKMVMPFSASSVYVRHIAIRADLACRSALQDRLGLFSNWQERMQQIRSLERYAE